MLRLYATSAMAGGRLVVSAPLAELATRIERTVVREPLLVKTRVVHGSS